MKIKRHVLNNLTLDGWCPICVDYTVNIKIKTGLPGVQCYQYKCGASFQVNFLEDNDDELEVCDSFRFPELTQ